MRSRPPGRFWLSPEDGDDGVMSQAFLVFVRIGAPRVADIPLKVTDSVVHGRRHTAYLEVTGFVATVLHVVRA